MIALLMCLLLCHRRALGDIGNIQAAPVAAKPAADKGKVSTADAGGRHKMGTRDICTPATNEY